MNIVAKFILLVFCLLLLSSSVLPRVRKRGEEELDLWFNFDDLESDIDQEFIEDEKSSNVHVTDPDMNKDPCQIILSRGFICHPHHPVTKDGYILTLYRIINPLSIGSNQRKRPILLMHGMMGSSADYVIGSGFGHPRPPPPKGYPYLPQTNNLAFELSNHGYG